MSSSGCGTAIVSTISEQLWVPAWGPPKNGPVYHQSWLREGPMGLCTTLLNYWHLVDSRGVTVIIFSCVATCDPPPHCAPMASSKPRYSMWTALVNISESQNKA